MSLDRRAADLVRSLDEHELRRLVILARGRLHALAEAAAHNGADNDPDNGGEVTVPAFGEDGPTVTFRRQSVRCGKQSCSRCPHGPYWYAAWREDGKVRTRYIGKTLPS